MILLIFDVDGTLVRTTNRQDSKSFAISYEELYQRPFPTIDWRHYPHVNDTTIFRSVIRDHFQREAADEEIRIFQDHYVEKLKRRRQEAPGDYLEVPGAAKTVKYLMASDDYGLGIATGGWKQPAIVKLEHVGIPASALLISGADGHTTREEILSDLIRQAREVYPDVRKMVYVGDAVWDVTTTRNLQLALVGIRYRNDREVLYEAGARTVLEDYRDRDGFLQAVEEAAPPGKGIKGKG